MHILAWVVKRKLKIEETLTLKRQLHTYFSFISFQHLLNASFHIMILKKHF